MRVVDRLAAVLTGLIALLLVAGCSGQSPLDATLAGDLARFEAEYGFTGLHVVERPDIPGYAWFLVVGTRDDGLTAVGLLGYTAVAPHGLMSSSWDAALPDEPVTFLQDNEGQTGSGETVWSTRAFGIIRDPRITSARAVLEDGRELVVAVHQPAYAIAAQRTSEHGFVRVTFQDAAGAAVATFPEP